MLQIAFIGCGLFVQQRYLPILPNINANLVACYSKSQENAQKMALSLESMNIKVSFYHSNQLETMLQRNDINAVIICVPIDQTASIINLCWKYNKHILSEKPIAADLVQAQNLLNNIKKDLVWGVAENFRAEEALAYASIVCKSIDPFSFNYVFATKVSPNDQYLNTNWRRNPKFNGGFLLDAGVHHIATLRKCIGLQVESVSAFTQNNANQIINQPDTCVALVQFNDKKVVGSFSLSYGAQCDTILNFSVWGRHGTVSISRNGTKFIVAATVNDKSSVAEFDANGVENQVKEWIACINQNGDATKLNTSYVEAMLDIQILSGILESGSKGGQPIYFNQ